VLRVMPCVPDAWPGYRLRYRLPGEATTYEIDVRNPDRSSERVVSVKLDGTPLSVEGDAAYVPLAHDATVHTVEITLGGKRDRR